MRHQKYDLQGNDISTYTDDERPYFTPVLPDWQKHKHLNVPTPPNHYSDLELSLLGLGATLEKEGYFDIKPPKKMKANMALRSFAKEGPTKEQLQALEKKYED